MWFENTVGKEEIARNEQFLLFPQCFPIASENSAIFVKFKYVVCKHVEFERVLNLLFGNELKDFTTPSLTVNQQNPNRLN